MATTNEDSTILAATHFEDGEMLMARQLSDRGTIEIAFWHPDPERVAIQRQALEIAASADEVDELARLCGALRSQAWDPVGETLEIARGAEFGDGAVLVALNSAQGLVLVRRPDEENRLELDRASFERLTSELLPKVRQKLATLGSAVP